MASIEDSWTVELRKLLELLDDLKLAGLNQIFHLPQIIVVGDQSSGKSSGAHYYICWSKPFLTIRCAVLNAIMQILFPRSEELCTKFPIQVILRHGDTDYIRARIDPDAARQTRNKAKAKKFTKEIKDMKDFPALVDEAAGAMGLTGTNSNAFSSEVLTVEICGPDRPDLTLVDLPGTILNRTGAQSQADIDFTHEIAEHYIRMPRTIVLAVISAKTDFACQGILEKCAKHNAIDRTMGIITKPDVLDAGSKSEKTWLNRVKGLDRQLGHGWHLLRNRTEKELNFSSNQRDEVEATFFSKGAYRELTRDILGVKSLRNRLSSVLDQHLRKELPSLRREINQKLHETENSLVKLGDARTTTNEQRTCLLKLTMKLSEIVKDAARGYYDSPFFGVANVEEAVTSETNTRRLRAVVEEQNLGFRLKVCKRGAKYNIKRTSKGRVRKPKIERSPMDVMNSIFIAPDEDPEDLASDMDIDDGRCPKGSEAKPISLSREEGLEWVSKVLKRSHGRELPGNFSPELIGQLFKENSENWKILAEEHVENVAFCCKSFLISALKHVTNEPNVYDRLLELKVDGALENACKAAQKELKKIIEDMNRAPMTYNPEFTSMLVRRRQLRYSSTVQAGLESINPQDYTVNLEDRWGTTRFVVDPLKLANKIEEATADVGREAATGALDCLQAYYKCERRYFIDAVAKQVIERHLIQPLPTDIVSLTAIASLTDEEVGYVMAEPAETTRERDFLLERKNQLESGRRSFEKALRPFR
ncbi:MAG: hypothetical protein M1820_003524 [Bogoriella megaspora]|nr:MAG: hypothetical protein M1820_003524 [Bogoriella megaspora]